MIAASRTSAWRAARGEQLRLGAAGRIQPRQAQRGVRANLGVIGVERAAHERGRARIVAGRSRSATSSSIAALPRSGAAAIAMRERRERAGRIQRAQRGHRGLAHEVVRIADRVREHRQHGLGADRLVARELDEPADRVAAHALRSRRPAPRAAAWRTSPA